MGVSVDSLVSVARRTAAPLRFTPMRSEDLDAVMEIERRSFPEPWTPGLFLHELKVPFSKTILAWRDDEIVGYICRWLVGDEVHILNIAVHPKYRGQGLGRRLIESVIAEAEEAGARMVTLEVRRENSSARTLYRKLGFVDAGVRRNYYGRGEDAIIMSRVRNGTGADPGA
jgi:ribosomal-protein-alanine N-acetyltransferase